MIRIFNGRVLDIDTNAPIAYARIYPEGQPNGGVQTDTDGTYSLAADDGNLATWYHIDAISKGYGDSVQQLGGLSGDFYLYKTDAGIISKTKALVKNNAFANILIIIAILIILFISKKYLQ